MFVCFVAAEVLAGRKHNFELAFPSTPFALEDFFGHCECTINNERRRLMLMQQQGRIGGSAHKTNSPTSSRGMASPVSSPLGAGKKRSSIPALDSPNVIRTVDDEHPFAIDVVKVFDHTLQRWLEVQDVSQVAAWSQFYAFSSTRGISEDEGDEGEPSESGEAEEADKQGVIPPPLRIRSPAVDGHKSDPTFFLFHDMDVSCTGYANREDLQRIFNVLGCFEISERSVDEMFVVYDKNRDGLLSYAEFAKLAASLPLVSELLLAKSHEYWSLREKYERRSSDVAGAICGKRFSKSETEAVVAYLRRRDELVRGQDARQVLSTNRL